MIKTLSYQFYMFLFSLIVTEEKHGGPDDHVFYAFLYVRKHSCMEGDIHFRIFPGCLRSAPDPERDGTFPAETVEVTAVPGYIIAKT